MNRLPPDAAAASRSRERALLALLAFNFGAIFLDRNALTLLMPFVAPDLGLLNTQIGLLSSGIALMWAISGYALTAFAERRLTSRSLLIALTLLAAFTTLLTGFAHTFAVLFMLRLASGVFAGPVLPISQAVVAVAAPSHHRGLQMGLMQSFGSSLMASVLAPTALISIALAVGWRAALWSSALVGLLSVLLMWCFLSIPPGSAPQATPVARPAPPRIRQLLANRNVRLCNLISIGMIGWLIVGLTFYPLYLVRELHLSSEQMGFAMGTLGISAMTGSVLVPYLSDRMGRKPIVVGFALIGAVAPVLMLLAHPGAWAAGGLLLISGLAGSTLPVFMSTIPAESLGLHGAAPAVGLIQGVGEGLGGVLMPFLAGVLADRFSLRAPLIVLTCSALGVAIVALALQETAPAITRARR